MNDKPLILTHRGDCENGIENTIHAVELAINQGATGIEIDIRQTGSGEIVVFHDFSLRRMFSRSGYLGKTTLAELYQIPYVNHIDKNEYYIDTLEAFLDRFAKKVPINLDAKTIHFFDFNFADKICAIIRNQDLFDHVWISCFNPFLLQILKIKDKRVRTGYLFQRTSLIHTTYDLITYTDAWHPNYRVLTDNLVNKARKNNKELYIWTVNDENIMRKVLQFQVDGVITDNVPRVRQVVDELH